MKFVVIVVVALAAFAAAETFDWGAPCTVANDCGVNKHNVYCRQVNPSTNGTAVSRCVQCMSADDCGAGEFCVSVEGVSVDGSAKYVGQCAHKQAPLHHRCSPAVTAANVRLGASDRLFCGFVTRWAADNSPASIEWTGKCVDKTCYECMVGDVSAQGNRKCYSFEAGGRGGFWGAWRAGNTEGSIMGVNQNATAQILIVVAFFSAAIFAVMAYAVCIVGKSKCD